MSESSSPPHSPPPARRRARSPLLQAELERIGREREAAEREATRASRWELVRACMECVLSILPGMACMGYALHTNDPEIGKIFWYGGMVLWLALLTLVLANAYRRGEERGDW